MKKQWILYALKLEKDKWYVGVTSKDLDITFKEHQSANAGEWTQRYEPIKISYEKDLGKLDDAEAQKIREGAVKKYRDHYGDTNVGTDEIAKAKTKSKPVKEKSQKKFFNLTVVLSVIIVILIITVIYLLIDKLFIAPETNAVIYQ